MKTPTVLSMPLPDAEARRRIDRDLEANLLVEAGAGSGKTTELVRRMVALVASGAATVDRIAAVTFTRKAAGELRERFQARLEGRIRELSEAAESDPPVLDRLQRALDGIDRAFVGTIHAFCARLLRERPLEVGLDPAFEELPVQERIAFRRGYWEAHLERLARDSDPVLEELSAAGLSSGQLVGLFSELVENPDVEFPAPEVSPPLESEVASVREELREIVASGMAGLPERAPQRGWDSLQKKIRTASFTLGVTGWMRFADVFEAVELFCKPGTRGHDVTQNRWRSAAAAVAARSLANAFGVGDTRARRLLDRWLAHRYALAIRLARAAADGFAEHRRRAGRLDFQDLLVLTARLLRTSPDARGELGLRYRYLLVDEFQDTDPLQAEIMLLLSSEPSVMQGPDEDAGVGPQVAPDWRAALPRPGALFVVGDPKQSIYRFRRADIQLYDLVKRRFQAFGAVVELTSNFRSRPRIGDLVNQVFDDARFFPREATAEQARFEALRTRPTERAVPSEGVFWYAVRPARDNAPAVAEDDAARLATWVGARIDSGERVAEDFLILTRVTKRLALYARALEARSIPVQVTGAGVGMETELEELILLLECMIDPTDSVTVVAVLVGLFFGLDHERLLEHRMRGGSFDVMRSSGAGEPSVEKALGVLHEWWRSASTEPADVFLARIVPELGLLPLAAAGDLGTIRAGALVYALDAVRATALAGDASLPGALAALLAALELNEAEAPLEPGRPGVVRLMNLHQAKGLEATVVVLADPARLWEHGVERHIERGDDGVARGYLRITDGDRSKSRIIARPQGWAAKEVAEQRFEEAEQVRLLYVAVTRAREELVVARWPDKPDVSAWKLLDGWLGPYAEELHLDSTAPKPREELSVEPAVLHGRTRAAAGRISKSAEPSFLNVSVTDVAKAASDESGGPAPLSRTAAHEAFRGYAWGTAVHGALAAAATGRPDGVIRAAARGLLVEHGRPLDERGEPTELAELLALVGAVRASALWLRATSAPRMLVEVPFAVQAFDLGAIVADGLPGPGGEEPSRSGPFKQLDLFVGPPAAGARPPTVLEGVIDLAFREEEGWVIADYKTDVGTDPGFPGRSVAYRRQLDLYADAWSRLTGEPVKQRVLFYTTRGRLEEW